MPRIKEIVGIMEQLRPAAPRRILTIRAFRREIWRPGQIRCFARWSSTRVS